MKDFLELIFKAAKERIKNPFIASFFLSWLIYNWKSVFIFFYSDSSIECIIHRISPKNGISEPGFWIPFLVAAFYILLVPYLMYLFDLLTKTLF